MPRPRSTMRKIREILRLSHGEGLSRRKVGAATGSPYSTIADHLARAERAGVEEEPAVREGDERVHLAGESGVDPEVAAQHLENLSGDPSVLHADAVAALDREVELPIVV